MKRSNDGIGRFSRRKQEVQLISDDEWLATVEKSLTTPNMTINEISLPGFPEKDIVDLTITNGKSVGMVRSAFALYGAVKQYAEKHGRPLNHESTVLDFGCGWGRIARFFLREVPIENLHGVDVVPKLVETCKTTFNSENFQTIKQRGNLPHESGSFDIVFANSVFSHLTEELNLKWLEEIRRVLKPGGLAMLTIVTEEKFDVMAVGAKDWIDSLDFEMNDIKAQLSNGNLAWISTKRKGELTGYGLAVIPHAWIEAHWGDKFSVLEVDESQSQAIIVLQKGDEEIEESKGLLTKIFSRT